MTVRTGSLTPMPERHKLAMRHDEVAARLSIPPADDWSVVYCTRFTASQVPGTRVQSSFSFCVSKGIPTVSPSALIIRRDKIAIATSQNGLEPGLFPRLSTECLLNR